MVKFYLVKVRLQKVNLDLILEQTRPVFLLELLLAEHHLDVARRVVDLAVLRVDLAKELELDRIRRFLGRAVPGEVQVRGLQVQSDLALVYVRYADR